MHATRIKKLAVATAIALGIGAGGGLVAQAAIPSATTNRITGCHSSGAPLRLIDADAGQTCNAGETKVSWGGGMRFRGVWTVAPGATNPGSIPYGSIDAVQKGDVIRYDGPVNHFGCTTPKGSWVNVVGAHSYPCLEYPQNWAPLALDGAQGAAGKNADVHWVKLDAAGKLAGSSDANIYVYPGTTGFPYTWIWVPWGDAAKCSVSANVTRTGPHHVTAETYSGTGYVVLTVWDSTGKAISGLPLDVTLSCGKYS